MRYSYAGYYTNSGVCDIAIYTPDDKPPVVIATELGNNEETSITKMAGYLAAEIFLQYLEPKGYQDFIWIEHHQVDDDIEEGFSQVTFDLKRISYVAANIDGKLTERPKFGKPKRRRISAQELGQLIGKKPPSIC